MSNVGANDLGGGAVGAGGLASGSVGAGGLAPGAVSGAQLQQGGAALTEPGAIDLHNPQTVRYIQTVLANLGYYKGRIDGIWGPKSEAANQAYLAAGGRPAGSAGAPGGGAAAPAPGGAPAAAGTPPTAPAAGPPDQLLAIPGGAETWRVAGGQWFVAYTAPGSNPPVPMVWRIRDDDQLKAIFGPDRAPTPTRELTSGEFNALGPIQFGFADELANKSQHPFDTFVEDFDKILSVQPWLRDPEILAITAAALLEGREVTDAELASTDWWKTHNDSQRSWIRLSASDPSTANQRLSDGRTAIRSAMLKAGISDPPDSLVNLVADRWTYGDWSEADVNAQIAKIADPGAPGELKPEVADAVGKLDLTTIADDTRKVDGLVNQWLGPAYARGWTDDQKKQWASKLHSDPNGEMELVQTLQQQRLALFPEYTNQNLTYDDIAAPWRSVVADTWGEPADETDPLFTQIVRANDLAANQQTLRQVGLQRGVGKVVNDALSAVDVGLGGSLRKAV